MKRKQVFYIAFFASLIAVFFIVITKTIPGFAKSRLPSISYVRPFAFINQDGKMVTDQDVSGKVYVAEYFFTTCKGICPRLNNNMKQVYEKFKNEPGFLILSHTCDPEIDSAAKLKHYADSLGVTGS